MKENEKKRRAKRDIKPKKKVHRAKRDVEMPKKSRAKKDVAIDKPEAKTVPIELEEKKTKPLIIALTTVFAVLAILALSILFMSPSIDDVNNPFESSSIMSPFGKKSAYNFSDVYRYFREPTLGTIYTLEDFFAVGKKGETEKIVRNKNSYNVLVVGKDRVGSNTDVIMIVNFDSDTQKINVLQVPRDTYVEDPINVGASKRINAIYAFAYMKYSRTMSKTDASHEAIKYLEGSLENTFGITIDNYFMIDLNGFVKVIDSIGGVEVDVPFDMYYNDEAQNLHIDLKQGRQVLDGDKSEQFVRFRNTYVLGDLGRVSAQKIFLSALIEKLLSPDWYSLDKLTSVASNLVKYSTTGMTLTDLVGYLKKVDFGKLSADSITFYTAPGESFFTSGGASMYTLYMKENLEIINRAFNLYNVEVAEDYVTLSEQMRTGYTVVDTSGLTAGEIGKDQPHIIVAKPRPTPSPSEEEGEETDEPIDESTEEATEETKKETEETTEETQEEPVEDTTVEDTYEETERTEDNE